MPEYCCPRCATVHDWYPQYPSRTQANKAGAIGRTDYHAPEDCIKHLRDSMDTLIERLNGVVTRG